MAFEQWFQHTDQDLVHATAKAGMQAMAEMQIIRVQSCCIKSLRIAGASASIMAEGESHQNHTAFGIRVARAESSRSTVSDKALRKVPGLTDQKRKASLVMGQKRNHHLHVLPPVPAAGPQGVPAT